MWLNAARLNTMNVDRVFARKFNALFPEGAKVSPARCVKIERAARDADLNINWLQVADRLLTPEGYNKFTNVHQEVRRETDVAYHADVDAAEARRHADRSRWRRNYQMGALSSMTREAEEARRSFEDRYAKTLRRIELRRSLRYAQFFGELSVENARPSVASKPQALKLRPGDVLVTSTTLRRLGSCDGYVNRFASNWPEGTVISTQLCVDHYNEFDWSWAAGRLLADGHYDEWSTKQNRRYDEVARQQRELRRAYDVRVGELLSEYRDERLTRDAYNDALREEERRYVEANERMTRELSSVGAKVFGELYALYPNPRLPELAG